VEWGRTVRIEIKVRIRGRKCKGGGDSKVKRGEGGR
jgi:hypothetical protein